jgi:peptidyl-prolyl cis-trans isomerase C
LKTRHEIIRALALLLALCIYPACVAAEKPTMAEKTTPVPAEATMENRVVAKVNKKEIRESDLMDAMTAAIGQNPQLRSMLTSDDQMNEFKKQILEQMITTELLLQESQKVKMKDLDTQIDEKIKELKSGFPEEGEFETALSQQGMSVADLRAKLSDSVRINHLMETKVPSGPGVSDEEIKAFYKANEEKFVEPEMVKASHILVRVDPGADTATREAARKKSEALLKRLRGGEDFSEVAKANSDDPSVSENGGSLGFFARQQMVPQFSDAAFALKPGELSDVVESPVGFHIIRAEEKKPEKRQSYEEIKERIAQYLQATASQGKMAEYIQSLRESSNVQVLVD